MGRDIKPSGGRSFSKTCSVRGREAEGRKAILVSSRHNTRIAPIGPDGLTLDGSEKVPTSDIRDVRPVADSSRVWKGPIPGIIGERGTFTVPSEARRRLGLRAGSPILIEVIDDAIVIRPAEIKPLHPGPGPTLAAILARLTAENRHSEFETGAAVGGEAW